MSRATREHEKDDYGSECCRPGAPKTTLPHPMPISITFFAKVQGDEPELIKIGTAYESATHHRFAPPDFGPVFSNARRRGHE